MHLLADIHARAALLEEGLNTLQILRLTTFEALTIMQYKLRVGPANDLLVDIRNTGAQIGYVLPITLLLAEVS